MKRQERHEVRDEAYSELGKIEGPQKKRGLARIHRRSVVFSGDKTAECSEADLVAHYSPGVFNYRPEGSPKIWRMENEGSNGGWRREDGWRLEDVGWKMDEELAANPAEPSFSQCTEHLEQEARYMFQTCNEIFESESGNKARLRQAVARHTK